MYGHATLAGTYQPVQFGGETGVRFPGLPTATGSTFVNFWLPSLARGHSGAWDLCCRGVLVRGVEALL
jgi:hypothetical protein